MVPVLKQGDHKPAEQAPVCKDEKCEDENKNSPDEEATKRQQEGLGKQADIVYDTCPGPAEVRELGAVVDMVALAYPLLQFLYPGLHPHAEFRHIFGEIADLLPHKRKKAGDEQEEEQ